MEHLAPIIDKVSDKVSEFTDWFSSLDEEEKNNILTIIAVIAAIGPLLLILGKIVGGIGTVISAMSKIGPALELVKGGFSSIFSFIASNPIVLLIAAIVGLVALIATKGDEIQEILQKVDDFLQNIFATDWTELFGPVLGNILNGFFANVKNIWDSIKRIFSGIIDFIRGVFTGDWERAWKGVQDIFGGIFDGLKAIAKAPLNGIISLINMLIDGVNWVIDKINKISFTNPFNGEKIGFDFNTIGKIPYLAKGGIVTQGSAIVGEAGPELLTVAGGRAVVQPLTNQNTTNNSIGSTVINVYGAPGQDVHELAEIVSEKISADAARKGAVFA